jgi:hypothetical protein
VGVIRKTMSISTGGLVDLRSDKERVALYTKQIRNTQRSAARKEALADANAILIARRQAKVDAKAAQWAANASAAAAVQSPAPAGAPPCWYADATDPALLRWWSGAAWTESTRTAEALTPTPTEASAPVDVVVPSAAAGPPPGWYDDLSDPTRSRWWDGTVWGEHTQPRTAP